MAWKQIKRSVSHWSLNSPKLSPNDDLTSMDVYDPSESQSSDEEPMEPYQVLPTERTPKSPTTPKTPNSIQSWSRSPGLPSSPSISVTGKCYNGVDINRNSAYIPKKSAPPPPSPPSPGTAQRLKYLFKSRSKPKSSFYDAPDMMKSLLRRASISPRSKKALKRIKGSKDEEKAIPRSYLEKNGSLDEKSSAHTLVEKKVDIESSSSYETASSGEEEYRTLDVSKGTSVSAISMSKLTMSSEYQCTSSPKELGIESVLKLGPPMVKQLRPESPLRAPSEPTSDESFYFFDGSPRKRAEGEEINWGDELAAEMVEMLKKHRLQ
ncbi:hypothetical protein FT663_02024 [Candidozyma haemuli var. vulneris]|nr:hypothetical protein FT662_01461 [[Candida] haemuloni var. vulneris]KAF3993193.1 hypothetical protein FT663_02024 [[Candida] haemuloni var. vulneris]